MDSPGALHDDLKKKFKNKSLDFELDFNLLYSLYNLPNILLPLIFGISISKYGVRVIYIIVTVCLITGQVMFTLGCKYSLMNVMFVGRIIYGFGGESLKVAKDAMLTKWFLKNEIAFPFGFTLSFGRFGTVLNDIFSPIISSVI